MKTVVSVIEILKEAGVEIDLNRIKYESESKPADDGVKFSPVSNTSKIYGLVFNENRANMSILLKLDGTVNIGANSFGLPEDFPTFSWKNYSIIRDGALNVEKMSVVVDVDMFKEFVAGGLLSGTGCNDAYIDLTRFPLCDPKTESAENYLKQMQIYGLAKGERKVYAAYLYDAKPAKASELIKKYGVEATDFLKTKGITDTGFASKFVKRDTGNKTPTIFETDLKDKTVIPSMNALVKKIEAGKKLNQVELVMKSLRDECEVMKHQDGFVDFLENRINSLKEQLEQLATSIGKDRIAIVVNGIKVA